MLYIYMTCILKFYQLDHLLGTWGSSLSLTKVSLRELVEIPNSKRTHITKVIHPLLSNIRLADEPIKASATLPKTQHLVEVPIPKHFISSKQCKHHKKVFKLHTFTINPPCFGRSKTFPPPKKNKPTPGVFFPPSPLWHGGSCKSNCGRYSS